MKIRKTPSGLSPALAILAVAALGTLSPARAQSSAIPAGQPAPRTSVPRAASADPAQSDAVGDKFRRLQKEMALGDSRTAAPRAEAEQAPPESIGVLSLSLKIFFGLIFVLVLAVTAIRLLKRFQGRMLARGGSREAGEIFEVLETCHLGPHQRVVALRMNGEVGIVGITQQGISLLTVLKEPADEVRRRAIGDPNPAAFSDNLNKLLDRFKRPKRVSDLLDET